MWARLALALLATATAGCAGLGADPATARETVTPAPVPEAESHGPVWAGPDGRVDARLLALSHGRALDGTGYTLVSNRTVRDADGSLRSRIDVRVALAANRTYRADVLVRGREGPELLGRPPANATFWSDGDRYLRRLERDNETLYNEFRPPDSYAGTWRFWVRSVALDVTADRAVARAVGSFRARATEREDGYLIEGDRPTDAAFAPSAGDVDAVENASLAAVATRDGLVRVYRLTYDVRNEDGERRRVHREVRFESVGETTVGRPDWYDRAADS